MKLLLFLYTILIVFSYVHVAHMSVVTVRCKCTCCVSMAQAKCKLIQLNSILLKADHCQTNDCRNACRQQYPNCQLSQGIIDGVCLQFVQ
jgi:hypothetical protein